MACHNAAVTPSRHAVRAARWIEASSRCSAPEALTVRNAPSTRSNSAPIRPTDSWDRVIACLIRGSTTHCTRPTNTNTSRVTPSSTRSRTAISTITATRVSEPVRPSTSDRVVTSRRRTVSEVTRDIRSPGAVRS